MRKAMDYKTGGRTAKKEKATTEESEPLLGEPEPEPKPASQV